MRLRTIGKRGLQAAVLLAIGYLAYEKLSEPTHDGVLERTYDRLRAVAGPETTIKVDLHEGAVAGSDGVPERIGRHRPDLVLQGFDVPNTYVEIKVGDDLTPRAAMQLRAYRRGGYKRVLVVPEEVLPAAEAFVEDIEGTVHVATPETVDEVVLGEPRSESA